MLVDYDYQPEPCLLISLLYYVALTVLHSASAVKHCGATELQKVASVPENTLTQTKLAATVSQHQDSPHHNTIYINLLNQLHIYGMC